MVYQLKNYAWREGANYSISAETVGNVLENIESRDGAITKKSFLEESRPDDAPTHKLFEWNDSKAAEKYRLAQAGKVISDLKIKLKVEEREEPIETTAILNIEERERKTGTYVNVITAMENKESRRIVLLRAISELQTFSRKYASLQELAGVFEAIREVSIA